MAQPARENSSKLYTPTVLALSVELAGVPLDASHPLQGHAKSRTCGSEVQLSASTDDLGAIESLGLQVTACAVGQASAALFANAAKGLDQTGVANKLEAMERWLEGSEASTIVDRLELLEPARAYPARHPAILLPWRAALAALSSEETSG